MAVFDPPFGLLPVGEDGLGDFGPTEFLVRPGMEGPQAIVSWVPPIHDAARIIIRRKLHEFPRDVEDGVLVLDDAATPTVRTSVGDIGTDLLAADVEPGDSRWWYYRMFVQPTPLPIDNQLAGLAHQLGPNPLNAVATEAVDAQPFPNVRIRVVNGAVPGTFIVQTAPEDQDALYVDVTAALPILANETVIVDFDDVSFKHLRVRFPGGFDLGMEVFFIVNQFMPFITHLDLSKEILVYRTGRHINLWWDREDLPLQVPEIHREEDEKQLLQYLNEEPLDDGELVALGRVQDGRGPMYRFLFILSLEFDRHHAYMKAILDFDTDIFEAPPGKLEHIAFEMGWQIDTAEDLLDVRHELLRAPGFYKRRGTLSLFQDVVGQIVGAVPRLLEGGGRVLRAADPSLFT